MRTAIRLARLTVIAALLVQFPRLPATDLFGKEFRINAANVPGPLTYPAVASTPKGDFVVTYIENNYVEARRYSVEGAPFGGPLRVNTTPAMAMHYITYDQVGAGTGGDFVVVWTNSGASFSGATVWGRRFSSAGVGSGSEFQVGLSTTTIQFYPSVGVDSIGNFVVAWQDIGREGLAGDFGAGIFAQRYSSSGAPLGGVIHVNSYSTANQTLPTVAMAPNGDFLVAWQSEGQDGSLFGIYAQRYAASGATHGGEFRVNTTTNMGQERPKAASDSSGNVTIVWESDIGDSSGHGILAQRISSAGGFIGSEFRVNTYTTQDQTSPSVAITGSGGFAVSWTSDGNDGSNTGIAAARFSASGALEGTEFVVNTSTSGVQYSAAIAGAPGSGFTVAWNSSGYTQGQMFRDMAHSGDVNGDGTVDVADVFYLINFLFAGGPGPK